MENEKDTRKEQLLKAYEKIHELPLDKLYELFPPENPNSLVLYKEILGAGLEKLKQELAEQFAREIGMIYLPSVPEEYPELRNLPDTLHYFTSKWLQTIKTGEVPEGASRYELQQMTLIVEEGIALEKNVLAFEKINPKTGETILGINDPQNETTILVIIEKPQNLSEDNNKRTPRIDIKIECDNGIPINDLSEPAKSVYLSITPSGLAMIQIGEDKVTEPETATAALNEVTKVLDGFALRPATPEQKREKLERFLRSRSPKEILKRFGL